jgi:hypothetical protein
MSTERILVLAAALLAHLSLATTLQGLWRAPRELRAVLRGTAVVTVLSIAAQLHALVNAPEVLLSSSVAALALLLGANLLLWSGSSIDRAQVRHPVFMASLMTWLAGPLATGWPDLAVSFVGLGALSFLAARGSERGFELSIDVTSPPEMPSH